MISGSFAAEIEHQIFAKQPPNSFKSGPSKRLLQKNMWLYLFYHSKNLFDADPNLPTQINQIMRLLNRLGTPDPALEPDKLREILCKAAGRDEPHRFLHVLYPTYSRQTKLVMARMASLKLSIFAAIGDIKHLENTLRSLNENDLLVTSTFGNFFSNALEFDQPHVLTTISAHLSKLGPIIYESLNLGSSMLKICYNSLKAQMVLGNETGVIHLLDFLRNHHRAVFSFARCQNPVMDAMKGGNSNVVRSLLEYLNSDPATVHQFCLWVSDFEEICRHFKRDYHSSVDNVLTVLIQSGMGIDHVWARWTPLTIAIQFSTPELVAGLLDAGANVNGMPPRKVNRSDVRDYSHLIPIELAMKRPYVETVKKLLDHGASVRNVKIASRNKAIYNMVRDAKMKETSNYVSTFAEYRAAKKKSSSTGLSIT